MPRRTLPPCTATTVTWTLPPITISSPTCRVRTNMVRGSLPFANPCVPCGDQSRLPSAGDHGAGEAVPGQHGQATDRKTGAHHLRCCVLESTGQRLGRPFPQGGRAGRRTTPASRGGREVQRGETPLVDLVGRAWLSEPGQFSPS